MSRRSPAPFSPRFDTLSARIAPSSGADMLIPLESTGCDEAAGSTGGADMLISLDSAYGEVQTPVTTATISPVAAVTS